MVWRNMSCFVLVLFILIPKRINPLDRKELKDQFSWVISRVVSGQADFCLSYYSAIYIPISLLMIIVGTTPLWSSLLGLWINREKVMGYEYLAMFLSFCGLIAIALSHKPRDQSDASISMVGVLGALGCAWCFSMCQVSQRKCRDVYYAVVNFYHTALGALAGLLYCFLQWLLTGESIKSHSTEVYYLLALMCFIDFIGVNCMTMAFQAADSTFVAIVGYSIVVYGFLVDLFYFNQPMTGMGLTGALLIFFVTVGTSYVKMK